MNSNRRVLLAWELGEGLGHAARLLTIAEHLRNDGWAPVVAARVPAALADRYAASRVPVIAAPPHRSCVGAAPFRAASFADIMHLDSGAVDRGAVLQAFSDSVETIALIGVITTSIPTL